MSKMGNKTGTIMVEIYENGMLITGDASVIDMLDVADQLVMKAAELNPALALVHTLKGGREVMGYAERNNKRRAKLVDDFSRSKGKETTRIRFGFRSKNQIPFFMIWKEYRTDGLLTFAKVLYRTAF